jgi:hypothetical protein
MRFKPKGIQQGLKPVLIAGNPAYRIDPRRDDLFKRLIELRHEVKMRRDAAIGTDQQRFDAEQNQLKVLASATSYDCYAEVNVESQAEQIDAMCFGSSGEAYQTRTGHMEMPGTYYHPLMATLITAGARLMLTIAELLAEREGLDWVFCDTDSMALAKPVAMSDAEFNKRADRVQEWFIPLNPYSFGGPLLQTEKYNYRLQNGKPTKDLEPLYCFAISSKRYALFNLDDDGRPILRKASAHGLGHWLEPPGYKPPRGIPAPATDLAEIGVRRWEYDLWYRIVLAALEGHPDQVDLSGFHGFNQPAVSRYSVTTPEYQRLFDTYNQSRATSDQVRPFNFLLAFQAKMGALADDSLTNCDTERSGRPKAVQIPRPIGAYSTAAAENCFDRDTGRPIEKGRLKAYADVLANYHLHPESKFLNGDWIDRGKLQRRHVEIVGIINIGKEANDLEDQYYLGADPEALPEYGMAPDGRVSVFTGIAEAAKKFGRPQLAEGASISLRTLASILGHKCKPTAAVIARLLAWISGPDAVADKDNQAAAEVLARARVEAQRIGLRQLARELEVDAANLVKVLAGRRKPSQRLLTLFHKRLDQSL